MFMVSVDQRLLIVRQESERKRKFEIRYWSHAGGMCGRSVAACAHSATDRYHGVFPSYLGTPASFAWGVTAYHVPPTPWPLVSPGLASPEKV